MRIAVVPLRWGAGVKGKVNSAMSHGVPVVCTTIAQEGMYLVNGEDALVEDSPRLFAEKMIDLYSNEYLWNKLRLGGFQNIRQHFSISNAVSGMVSTFEVVLDASSKIKKDTPPTPALDTSLGGSPISSLGSPISSILGGEGGGDSSSSRSSLLLDQFSSPSSSSSSSLVVDEDLVAHEVILKSKIDYGKCALNTKCECLSEKVNEGRASIW
jgi:hypothetical protein